MSKNADKVGEINLRGLFQAAALSLQIAVKQGQILHRTKNIRDSGTPLEHQFREFLRSRLPKPFSVVSGYLFEPSTRCTPQIDCIVIDDRESHEIMRSEDGSSYIPYPAGRIMVEVKNSAAGTAGHLKQIAASRMSVRTMITNGRALGGDQKGSLDEPLAVLLIGYSGTARLSSFKKAFARNVDQPDYTLLLDRGLIIARRRFDDTLIAYDGQDGITRPFLLDNSRRNGGEWGIWAPEGHAGDSGHALLWLHFALIADLSRAGASAGSIIGFTNQIVRDYPMVLKSDLSTATAL